MFRHALLLTLVSAGLPVLPAAEDAKPELVSRTGGKGAQNQWASVAEMQKAAEAGNPAACYHLGEMHLAGDEVPVDVARAVVLLEKAAEAGHSKAAFRLGKLHADGEVVPQNLPYAFQRYQAAARAGEAEAQYNLGAMYASGRGVKRDYVQGLAWLIVAAKNGADPEGEAQLRAHLLKLRRTEMIAAAEERAGVIKNELQAPAGSASSGAPENTDRGRTAERPAPAPAPKTAPGAKTGPTTTGMAPGRIPLPVPQPAPVLLPPPPRAQPAAPVESGPAVNLVSPLGRPIRWEHFSALERAADKGQAEALSDLAQVLIAGKLVPADPERAVLLLERAVAAGSPDGAYQLAEVIVKGVHHPKDEAKAFALYRQAAFGGSPVAMFNVAAFLSQGAGVKRDYTEALAWILLAKKRGVERADVEGRLRAHLQKSAPAQIAAAETRAQRLDAEIATSRK